MLPLAKQYLDSRFTIHDSRLPTSDCFVDVFCEKNAFDLEQSRRVLTRAKSLGFKLKAHVDEFTNLGGARMAIELGATSIDHLDTISDAEIKLLAASETIGIVTPTVNFNFGAADFADARKMIDADCAIAVSTDYNPGSAPCPSLPNAMAIACRYQKLLPAEAFNAVTINAACAVAAGGRIGSLEAGKTCRHFNFGHERLPRNRLRIRRQFCRNRHQARSGCLSPRMISVYYHLACFCC